jgi:GNAT superfamily N-acetyltransferase
VVCRSWRENRPFTVAVPVQGGKTAWRAAAAITCPRRETSQSPPPDWADIATFVTAKRRASGVGTALFPETKAAARELELAAINAAIRADNPFALAYYEKMGFETYGLITGSQPPSGTSTDRVLKRYLMK